MLMLRDYNLFKIKYKEHEAISHHDDSGERVGGITYTQGWVEREYRVIAPTKAAAITHWETRFLTQYRSEHETTLVTVVDERIDAIILEHTY